MSAQDKLNLLSAGNYIFKVNNRNTRLRYELCSKLITETLERRHLHISGVFIVNFVSFVIFDRI